MGTKIPIVVLDRFYVPEEHVDTNRLEKLFHKTLFDEKKCSRCEFQDMRPCSECEECEGLKANFILWNEQEIDGKPHIGLPVGNKKAIRKLLRDAPTKVDDRRSDGKEIDPRIKFNWKTLYKYQKKAVKKLIDTGYGILKSAPRTGKCIVGSSLVMTDKGLHRISDMFDKTMLADEGETILTSDSSIATYKGERNIAHLYTKVVDTTIKIKTKDGFEIQGTPNHPLMVMNSHMRLQWKTLSEISPGDYIAISRKRQWLGEGNSLFPFVRDNRHSQDSCTLQTFPKKVSRPLARLLGYWVANGSMSLPGRLGITSNNKKVRRDFIECMNQVFPGVSVKEKPKRKGKAGCVIAHSLQVARFLQEACGFSFGTAREKSVPSILLKTDKQYLLEFLGAYLTCDAWIAKTGIQILSASKKLGNELHAILPYLGIVGSLSVKKSWARNGTGTIRDYYSIWLHANEARKLLELVDIRKSYKFTKAEFVNQHDIIPYMKKFVRELQNAKTVGYSWLKDGYLYSRNKYGKLLPTKKGLRGDHLNRKYVNHVNTELLEWLDNKEYEKFLKSTNPDLYFSEVVSARIINKPIRVYDVEVPVGHHFVANSIVNHNTVMGAAVIIYIGKKALIVLHQDDLAKQFMETFHSADPAFTNIPKLEERTGKQFVGICRKFEDFKKHDICIATYQTFLSKGGKKLFKKIKRLFGTIIVDECHRGSAKGYSKVLNGFESRHRFGLSGTPKRKDGRHILGRFILGHVVHETEIETLAPIVEVVETGYKNKKDYKGWPAVLNALVRDGPRTKKYVDEAVKQIRAGRSVLIPVERVAQAEAVTKAINIILGKELAVAFTGKKSKDLRRKIILNARSGKYKCVVAIRKLLTGVNVPRWDCLIGDTLIPSNKGLLPIKTLVGSEQKPTNIVLHNGIKSAKAKFGGPTGTKSIYTLYTKYGANISASKNQKLLAVTDEGNLGMRKISELKSGDFVVVRPVPSLVSEYVPTNYTRQMFIDEICSKFGTTWDKVKSKDFSQKCPVCKKVFSNLSGHYAIAHPTAPKIEQNPAKRASLAVQNYLDAKIPTYVDEKLAYLIGMLITDGCVTIPSGPQWYNNDGRILKKIRTYMKELFDLTDPGYRIEARFASKLANSFFHHLGIKGYAKDKTIPDCILASPPSVINAFLGGMVDGDSMVKPGTVTLSSTNKDMLTKAQHLIFHNLNSMGRLIINDKCSSVIFQGHTVENLRRALSKWSVKLSDLKPQLNFLRETYVHGTVPPQIKSRILALVSRNGIYYDEKGKKLTGKNARGKLVGASLRHFQKTISMWRNRKKDLSLLKVLDPQLGATIDYILDNNMIFLPIVGVGKEERQVTYDFAMKNSSTPQFVAGCGFVVHNCILEVMPMNNEPNFEQEYRRICTPMEGKPRPIVKFYIDEFGPSMSCVVNMYDFLVRENIERIKKKYTQFQFSEKAEQLIMKYRELKKQQWRNRVAKSGDYSHGYGQQQRRVWKARY